MPIVLQRAADISVSQIAGQPTVLDAAGAVSRVYDFEKHPYFVWMRDPATRLEEFRSSQAPYRYMVENFSRGLAAILSRISAMGERISTVYGNVAEEHGYGESPKSHRSTFLGYLHAIGVKQEDLEAECPIRMAVAYESLLAFCLTNPPEMGAAAMGIVEYTHIKIATMIAQGIHDRFWGDVEAQHHYRLHAEIDADHALGLFALCQDGWSSAQMRHRIAYSMAFGAQVWWSVFDALCPAEPILVSKDDGIRGLLDPGAAPKSGVVVARPSPRVDCELPVVARVGGGQPQETTATALNHHGLLLRRLDGAALDAEVDLAVRLPDRAEPLALSGRVRSLPWAKSSGICVELRDEDKRAALGEAAIALERAQADLPTPVAASA